MNSPAPDPFATTSDRSHGIGAVFPLPDAPHRRVFFTPAALVVREGGTARTVNLAQLQSALRAQRAIVAIPDAVQS